MTSGLKFVSIKSTEKHNVDTLYILIKETVAIISFVG